MSTQQEKDVSIAFSASAPTYTHAPTLDDSHFRALIENSTDAIALLTSEGKILYASPSTERILGFTSEEFMQLPSAFSLTHPDDISRVQEAFEDLTQNTGTSVSIECRVQHKDGLYRWIATIATNLLHDPAIGAIVCNYRDITDSKRVEQERDELFHSLQETNALLDTLFNEAPIGMGFWDKDLRFVRVNRALAEMNGRTPEEHVGKTVEELLTGMDPAVMEAFRSVATTGKTLHMEAVGETHSQPGVQRHWAVSYYPVRIQDAIVGVGAICEEITEARRIEAEREIAWRRVEDLARQLETQRAGLEEVLRQMPSGVVIAEAPSGNIILANKQVEEILRHPVIDTPDIQSYTAWRGLHQDGTAVKPEEWPLIRALTQNKVVNGEVIQYLRGDDTLSFIRISAAPVFDTQGNVVAAVALFYDVTEQKQQEMRKDDFISMASHELKTPLTSIKAFTQILYKQLSKEENQEQLRYLSRMDIQINKLTKLIANLLDISKIQADKIVFERDEFDFNQLLHEVVENVQQIAPHHDIIIEHTHPQPFVGDRDRLEDVLVNLLNNAIKYSPDSRKVLVNMVSNDSTLTVSIQDFGVGISKRHQQRIFERFYRVYDEKDKKYPGMGIGLYISHEIIERHGGKMWVESEEGKGAIFYFSLPLSVSAEK